MAEASGAGGVLRTLRVQAENIKLEHTIFALPFAYLGSILAAGGWPGWSVFFWVTVAMAAARTAAMSLNRYIDRHIDARNPRTARRPIPAGQLKAGSVLVTALVSMVVLVFAAAQLNPLCLLLSPLALIALVSYSYTKRWTPLCHLALGLTDGIAPAGGWLAVNPSFSWAMVLLVIAVSLWIAGFDVLYACQDIDFDRREGLHSIPADFGARNGLLIAKGMHIGMLVALLALGVTLSLAWPFYVGLAITAALLSWEHALVKPDDLSKINLAFFNINGYIAMTLFICTFAATVL